jgi:hypothetical protein
VGPRCAWCHDDVDGGARAGGACRTLLHADCAALAGACPTLGCGRSAGPGAKARWPTLRAAAQAVVTAAGTLPLLALAGIVLLGLYLAWPEPEPGWADLGPCCLHGPGACERSAPAPADPDRALREQLRAWVDDDLTRPQFFRGS